ncbi:hypothetical protein [Granulicella sp. L46]|uniref:hypothetical protein n=1 Tax=Granulicella sp. L46 TaxID=1641865 RepID=UPI00131DF141|nr:hypothetical protein [Granulicella sp. L46]
MTEVANQDGSTKQVAGDLQVEYSGSPTHTWPSRMEAQYECAYLNGALVKLGFHICSFTVEELPGGRFGIVCLDHSNDSHL